ncbi:MAG TPA: hypothetical protein VK152_05330 [Paludibacter sp.]|nr:hypothetical protein [Paludibacter sp.]
MSNLRKQIRESFFNPVLHLFPLVLYLVINEFYGMQVALEIAYPFTIVLAIYIFAAYNQLFKWHLNYVLLFVTTTLLTGFGYFLPENSFFRTNLAEIVVLTGLVLHVVFREPLQRYFQRLVPRLVPMSNNYLELNRAVWIFALVLALDILLLSVASINARFALEPSTIRYGYTSLLGILMLFETIRVQFARSNLMKEEWWPIVSDQGKIIGSIHNLTSLNDTNKYKHPVVRVMLIDHGMVLLQKIAGNDPDMPGVWDTAISNHVKLDENIDQCVDRTAVDRYGLANFRYMYLSNYSIETKNEYRYAFLFVSCQMVVIKPNIKYVDQTKWWTQKQIEGNLDTGIFSDSFKIEYDFLKRSGLLETGKCECTCHLKDVIYEQTRMVKKD